MENNRKDPRRQLIGAVSKALGQQFERDINAAFDHYRRLGVASIEKTPEPFHMTGRENGGKVVGFYEKKAQPDYAGTLRGGRSVYMEAKFTGSNRMEQSRVSPGQTEYLDEKMRLGAFCYVLAGFSHGSAYCIPYREEIIRTNPMNKIDNIKFKREKEKALTDMEIEVMRQACQTTMQKAIMEMLLSTGCRAAELVSIKIADMDEDKVSILGKGGKWRTVYINAKAFVAVKNYLADRKDTNPYLFPREINTKDRTMISNFSRKDWFKDPRLVTKADHFGRDSVNNMVRTIGKRAGVKGVHTHRFRRTCATQALRHGMPIELVSMMLGHEQISTTQIYLDIRDDDLQAAHRKYVV